MQENQFRAAIAARPPQPPPPPPPEWDPLKEPNLVWHPDDLQLPPQAAVTDDALAADAGAAD